MSRELDPTEEVCAVALLREDGACLLQHRDNKPGLRAANVWTLPGGHRHGAEPLRDCALREFEEETGYRCRNLRTIGVIHDVYYPELPPYLLHVFYDMYDGHSPISCYEGQAMEFVTRDAAAQLKTPRYILALWDLVQEAALT